MNRREFLTAGVAGLSLAAFGPHVAYGSEKPLRVGLIGTGWYGKNDLYRLIQVTPVDVVSLCDVDQQMLEDAAGHVAARQASHKKPRLYNDYQKMLKEAELEVVLVGTPDHWHALPMIAACEAGADVYVQKPISTDVKEGEAMVAAARKHGRVVQVGTQRRSTPHLMEAKKKVIESGMLGRIGHVDICCYYHMRAKDNPPAGAKVPDYLDYEAWTGPAPMRPYDQSPHKRWWRAFMEYGNGITGDMCVHMLDMVRWMLGLGWPSRITSSGGIWVQTDAKSNISDTQQALFEFDQPKLNVAWIHRTWGNAPDPEYPWAAFIYGENGTLKASTSKYEFFPTGKNEASISVPAVAEPGKYPEEKNEKDFEPLAAAANREHMRNFLQCRKDRSKPVADIEQGHISTASCILANLAMDLKQPIELDASGQVTSKDPAILSRLARPYRQGYTHPGGATDGKWEPWSVKPKA